ncbi:hypothetical protein G6F65_020593 [Rhizopus arrhizus]|nr:hypothetical protein G6F65_020593 [Rhizopus arrhizus]
MRQARMPDSSKAIIRKDVATGRRMKGRARLMRGSGKGRDGKGLDDLDIASVVQAVHAFDHDAFGNGQARFHDHVAGVGGTQLQDPARGALVVADDEHEGALGAILHGGRRNGDDVVLLHHGQPDVHELVGKQRFVGVVEAGAQADGATGCLDAVVQRFQAPSSWPAPGAGWPAGSRKC